MVSRRSCRRPCTRRLSGRWRLATTTTTCGIGSRGETRSAEVFGMTMRSFSLAAVVIAAQVIQPQGCKSPAPPSSDSNPPITDQFTTQDGIRLGVQTIVTNVEIPWDLAFAPDGRLFFTERPGRVRRYQTGQLQSAP